MARTDPTISATSRRRWLKVASSALLAACTPRYRESDRKTQEKLVEMQKLIGGRLGVYALDTGTRRRISLNADDRFAMASTFKFMLAAHVLTKVDNGEMALSQTVTVSDSDLVYYSPVTEQYVASGSVSIEKLCEAVVTMSDNAAANLLLAEVGGPEGHTNFLRSLGDRVSQLNRIEPELNANLSDDRRDTSSPRAMAGNMELALLRDLLSNDLRAQLNAWLVASKTGARRLRAGVPAGWRVGDKTGTGMNGAVNNLAIIWPPERAPILLVVMMSESDMPVGTLNKTHAAIAKLVLSEFVAGP